MPSSLPSPEQLSLLAGLMAHELSSPLARIARAAELLRLDDLDRDERDAALDLIDRAVRQADAVLARLRGLHSGDELVVSPRPTDVAALVRRTVADLADEVLAAHPTDVDAPAELDWPVDPSAVQQVLTNLLSNAARYSPAGRPINVTVTDGGDRLTIAVRDGGRGVAPEDAERIFDLWVRGDGRSGGLGLGLYLARRIARAHGGDVRLEPARVEGAVFVLELPWEPHDAERSRATTQSARTTDAGTP